METDGRAQHRVFADILPRRTHHDLREGTPLVCDVVPGNSVNKNPSPSKSKVGKKKCWGTFASKKRVSVTHRDKKGQVSCSSDSPLEKKQKKEKFSGSSNKDLK